MLIEQFFQFRDFACLFPSPERPVRNHRYARRIIPAVFEPLERIDDERLAIFRADVTDYAAHVEL